MDPLQYTRVDYIHRKCQFQGWTWWCMPSILANQESKIRGLWFKASLDKNARLYLKKVKRLGV
jgi:hypothetical protein